MFRFLTLFPEYDADKDGGGSDGGTGSDGDKKPDENKDKSGPGADDKGGGDKKSPEKTEDDKITLDDFNDLQKRFDDLTSKAGKQGNELGKKAKDLDELTAKMKTEPLEFIKAMAEHSGIELNFDKKTVDPHKDLMSDDEATRKAAMDKMAEDAKTVAIKNSIMAEISPAIKSIQEDNMARRYKDFDILHDDRNSIEAKVNASVLTRTELLHLAARGQNVDGAIEAAKVEAVKDYVEELRLKAEAGADTGGVGDPNKGATKTANMVDYVKHKLKMK